MNRPEVIEKLKNQCENLDISKSLLEDIFTHGYNWEWLLESNKEHKKFGKILKIKINEYSKQDIKIRNYSNQNIKIRPYNKKRIIRNQLYLLI